MSDANLTFGVDLKLSELIDNLSEKLGVASEKLTPIAKEGLDQYILRETVYTCVLFSLTLLFFILIMVGFKIAKNAPKPANTNDVAGVMVAGVILCVLSTAGFIITLSTGIVHLGKALAPLPSILGL